MTTSLFLTEQQPTTEHLLWFYTLEPNVRDRLERLLGSRCKTTLDPHLHQNKVHLTILLHAVHNIWHTVWDDAPIEHSDDQMLRTLEGELRNQGDAIVTGFLENGRLYSKGDIMYMLVRNIRTEIRMTGLGRDCWVLFNVTNNDKEVRVMYQRAGAGEGVILVEDIPWRQVLQYLANVHFQLDHRESDQFGTFEEQLGLERLEQSSKVLDVTHPDILRSLSEI